MLTCMVEGESLGGDGEEPGNDPEQTVVVKSCDRGRQTGGQEDGVRLGEEERVWLG